MGPPNGPRPSLFVVVPTGTAGRIKDIAGASTSIVVDIVPLSSGPMTLTGWGSVETPGLVWIGSGSIAATVSAATQDARTGNNRTSISVSVK